MRDQNRRDLLAALAIALVMSAVVALPPLDRVRGLSIDALTWLRWIALGSMHDPATSPTVVVAIDEETYRRAPFANTPSVTWTREIGNVLTSVIDGGAKVVGFDIIFPTSIEQSAIPFGDETLGARVRGFDRDYLRALADAAKPGKLVLGQVQHQKEPIRPSDGQRAAVGQQQNIRPLNFQVDSDDVIRRLPLSFDVDGHPTASFAAELAARARGGGAVPPGGTGSTLTLNFEGGADDIPTYSLADLRACREKGDTEYFRKHFAGRVVLFGTLLDVEDRHLTSKRLATGIEGARAERCALPVLDLSGGFARDSLAGAYVHATAINNLIRGDSLSEPRRAATWAAAAVFAIIAAGAGLLLAPLAAVALVSGVALAWTAAATWAFASAVVLPLLDAALAGLLALVAAIAYRSVVADRDKLFLRRSFALYLAPPVIEKMLAAHRPPSLGGEKRNVTIYISDVIGFSSLAERMGPDELVSLMNAYLSAMTDIIEEHGGFVDKYIGDSIVAVFGAPLDDPAHAIGAVNAALACQAKLSEMNASAVGVLGGHRLGQRIGLSSGEALVGNMGSRRRFNYTAMGDVVNLASRLEGANRHYATSILVSDATAALAGNTILWREIDTVHVAGRGQTVTIFEPIGQTGAVTSAKVVLVAAYADGLDRWRAGDFAGAAQAFSRFADQDPPSFLFRERARAYVLAPLGASWKPINVLDVK